MRDLKFLHGVLCGAVLTLAGVAIAHKNPENENDTVKPLIIVPGNVPRYSGQQGREADITELLATSTQTGGKLGIFRQTIAPGSGPPTHLHQMEIEFTYVVSGQSKFKVGDRAAIPPFVTFIFFPPTPLHTLKH